MRLRNLTPHRLRVLAENDNVLLDLPAPATPARIAQTVTGEALIDGAPVRTIAYAAPHALPEAQPNIYLVVSRVVASEVRRADLLFPDEEVRDEHGRIVGCRALARFHRVSP